MAVMKWDNRGSGVVPTHRFGLLGFKLTRDINVKLHIADSVEYQSLANQRQTVGNFATKMLFTAGCIFSSGESEYACRKVGYVLNEVMNVLWSIAIFWTTLKRKGYKFNMYFFR